ncbi:MAG: hypothetical protein ACJ8R9_16005 [Steroidobacteraceae bacterium]
MKSLRVAKRFCGPPTSANGGYFAGLIAALVPHTLSVRLRVPPPLDTELSATETDTGSVEVRHGDIVVGEGSPATLDLQPPRPPSHQEAIEATRNYVGFARHWYPTCFVCGVRRAQGDGLCIYAGEVPGRGMVAAPWTPDETLDRGDGLVRPEFMSAALDCPGYYAVTPGERMMLLAQLTVQTERLVRVGEACTIIGWRIGSNGRKHEAGTALYGADGELCGLARALWVEPRGAG